METFLKKIHGLPDDTRKLLAGLCMLAAGIAFFSIWISFVSSHLIALSPNLGSVAVAENPLSAPATAEVPLSSSLPAESPQPVTQEQQSVPVAEISAAPEALSPLAGMADTARGFGSAVSGVARSWGGQLSDVRDRALSQGFFASVGERMGALGAGIGDWSQRTAEFIYRTFSRYIPPNL